MTDKELFIETLKDELPRFERVIKAVEKVPKRKHSHKHDPKSRTAFELVSTISAESAMFPIFLKTGKLNFMTLPKPSWKTVTGARMVMTKNMKNIEKIVMGTNQKKWDSKCQMFMGDKMEWESTRGRMAWSFLLDLIHHRGQLSTYLRPMGGKVPSIYGPSADTNS